MCCLCIPKSWLSWLQRLDSNCLPRSVITVEGTPNLAIQPRTKALATDSAVMSIRGNASGQCVNLSMHVRRYLYPWEGGRGPTISTWTTSKRASGGLKDNIVAVVCLVTLARWHWGQMITVLVHLGPDISGGDEVSGTPGCWQRVKRVQCDFP